MSWWGRVLRRSTPPVNPPARRVFHSTPVADFIAALSSGAGKVTRAEALTVPAVVRGRNELCAIATLPLRCYDAGNVVVDRPLLRQFDPSVGNVVHLAMTIEDLLFEGISWWRILAYGWDGFPVSVMRVEPGSVSVNPPVGRGLSPLPSGVDPRNGGVVYVDGLPVSGRDMIRFDSPNPGLLTAGARAIRTSLALDKAGVLYATTPPAREVLRPADGQDLDQPEIDATLADYEARSKAGVVRWLPSTVQREQGSGYSPAEIQLVELKRQSVLELANLMGLDPEELGLSTTSRTYKNINERRIDKVNETLAPYLSAVTDRLNMRDASGRGNVFPGTLTAKWDLTDYLKADALDRSAVQRTYFDMGVLSADEIRTDEGRPGPAPGKVAPPVNIPDAEPAEEATVDAARELATVNFADDARLTFVPLALETFSVDHDRRTITGVALPYGRVGNGYRFERGALQYTDPSRIKLNLHHDRTRTVGVATAIKDSPQGLRMSLRIAATPEGDAALQYAQDGVLDGLSVEIDPPGPGDTVPDPRHKNGVLVKKAVLRGVALTGDPAFDDARIERVVMSKEEVAVPDTDTEQTTAQTEPVAVPAPSTTANTAPAQFTAEEMERLRNFARMVDASGRAVVDPTRRPVVTTQVAEVPYRFDRSGTLQAGTADFGVDLVRATKLGNPDSPEWKRVMEFMNRELTFDIATGDVNELNPTITQARFIDERQFMYPLFAATNRGTPPNGVQPFKYPVYSSASNFVDAHEEGTEPGSGGYVTADHATITPAAYSGKARINREVWDMGGQPGISDLVWRKVVRSWFETIEGVIAGVLDAASPTSLGTFTAGGGTTGQTLVAELRKYLTALQFARGGFRFTDLFGEFGFYTDLAGALDTTGRPIFPAISPMNADGTVAGQWSTISVNGLPVRPAWALGATSSGTTPDSSYLVDRDSVDTWTTGPQRLDMTQTAVAYVDIGVWGYMASTINDLNGVREVIYAETSG